MAALSGKTAIVVGGGRGLGRCVALAMAREGADVIIAARTKPEIDHVAGEITRLGHRALAVKTDAVDYEQVKKMVQDTLSKFEKIDILVNCQGQSLVKPTFEVSPEEWDVTLNSNLKSVFQTCAAVLPNMVKQRSGHIINISSKVAATGGAAGVAAYTAAKAGVIGLSQSLALEFKSYNIKVNVICPAPMDTTMRWKATPDFDRKKVMRPEEIAELVVLLASWPNSVLQEPIVPASVSMFYGVSPDVKQ